MTKLALSTCLLLSLAGCGDPPGCPSGTYAEAGRCLRPGEDAGPPTDAFFMDDASAPQDACVPTEETCDGLDQDCDGLVDEGTLRTFFADHDGDGHGDPEHLCEACDPNGCVAAFDWVEVGDDCDDTCEACAPGATETCDGVDQDCDGATDEGAGPIFFEDLDGDGFGDDAVTLQACEAPAGYVAEGGDCAPEDARAFPGQRAFFTEPVEGVGRHDFDCDGVETHAIGVVAVPNCPSDCRTVPAWNAVRPRCGVAGETFTCFHLRGSCSGTTPQTEPTTAACR